MEDEDVRVSTDLNPSEDLCKKNLKSRVCFTLVLGFLRLLWAGNVPRPRRDSISVLSPQANAKGMDLECLDPKRKIVPAIQGRLGQFQEEPSLRRREGRESGGNKS